jgi:hypothetical protein
MRVPYHAAFLVPLGATKTLGDEGWMITSDKRLPPSILGVLTQGLDLKFLETYLGIGAYQCETMKAEFTYDDEGKIEYVYFQVFRGDVGAISDVLEQAGLLGTVELFVPGSQNAADGRGHG